MSVDLEHLTRQWSRSWPDCPPVGYLFRHRMPDRWIRFHCLPFGRRRPADATDRRQALDRYNAVLNALVGESDSDAIRLVTVRYGQDDTAAGTEPTRVGLHRGAVQWMRVPDPSGAAAHDLWVSDERFSPHCLDDLLSYIIDDRTSGVVVIDSAMRWLFHPYDGGMDVIAASLPQRDELAARFAGWLSHRADGL